jgi:hypothetical protein
MHLVFLLKRHLLQETLDLVVVVLSEMLLIAFNLHVELLNSRILLLLRLDLSLVRIVNLDVDRLANVLTLFNLLVHLTQLLFQFFLFLILTLFFAFLLIDLLSTSFLRIVFLAKSQVTELSQNADVF